MVDILQTTFPKHLLEGEFGYIWYLIEMLLNFVLVYNDWSRLWLVAWTDDYPVFWCLMVSLGHNVCRHELFMHSLVYYFDAKYTQK